MGAALLLCALLVAGLRDRPAGLYGELRGSGPYLVGPQPAAVQIGPPNLFDRLAEQRWGGDGLRLTTWGVSYGSRWQRAVTVAELRGPLEEEGESWCGIAARISPGVFDPKQSGAGLLDLVRGEMNKVLPLSLPCGFSKSVKLGKAKTVSLSMVPRMNAIDLKVVAVLADGTRVGATSTVALVANAQGQLVVDHIGSVEPLFSGPGRAQCEGTLKVRLGQLFWRYIKGRRGSVLISIARTEMQRRITPALDALNRALSLLHQPMRLKIGSNRHAGPTAVDHDVEISLRLARQPEVSPDGVALRLCASVQLRGARQNATITGPARTRAEPPEMPAPGRGAQIGVNLNAEAINRMVYTLWQLGALRRWGRSTGILDQLPETVKSLAFDVTGFDPRLPPVFDPVSGRVTAANIAVGRWGDRTVLGYATGKMRLNSQGSRVRMTAEVDRLAVNCAQQDGDRWLLTPCLSELLPMVRDQLAAAPPRFSMHTSDLVQALAERTVYGLRLALSPPRLELQKGVLKARMSVKIGSAGR